MPRPKKIKPIEETVPTVPTVPKDFRCDTCQKPLPESFITKGEKQCCTLACANRV